jgi:type VI secretion system protein ImpL
MSTALNVNTGVNNAVGGVGKFFRFLLHPLFLALLGVIAISALVWYVGPLIAIGESRPLDPHRIPSPSSPSCSACCCCARSSRLESASANAALVEGMTKGPSSADKEIATLNQRFGEALNVLKKTPEGERRTVSQLPWYMFIGAPGSGKTTALMNAGLTFPLAEKMGGASVRGVGGTRNCDWWFTDEAVLIDTAGRYTTQESNSAVDASAWDGFLALLRKSRPRRQTGGVLLVQHPGPAAADAGRAQGACRQAAGADQGCRKSSACARRSVLVTKANKSPASTRASAPSTRKSATRSGASSFPYAPISADDPLVNFGSIRRPREATARPGRPLMDAEHRS